jgi:hypothetical protein
MRGKLLSVVERDGVHEVRERRRRLWLVGMPSYAASPCLVVTTAVANARASSKFTRRDHCHYRYSARFQLRVSLLSASCRIVSKGYHPDTVWRSSWKVNRLVLYALLIPGLSQARSEPPAVEVAIATWLLHQSVPNAAKIAVNPLGTDPADVSAGRDLYRQKCEVCHAYDGSGQTALAPGQYPRPPALRSAALAATPDRKVYPFSEHRSTAPTPCALPGPDMLRSSAERAMPRLYRPVDSRQA